MKKAFAGYEDKLNPDRRERVENADSATVISNECTGCGLCSKECRFLEIHGGPGAIAAGYDPTDPLRQDIAFECSLCGLCTSVCPSGLDPEGMFLEMRRQAVRLGRADYPEHAAILAYEKRGTSPRYTWYGLPNHCDTVLFPGCSLPGTRPQTVKLLFARLREVIPTLGVVLDCCMKPSHDLGREKQFQAMFGEMKTYLVENGIRTVLLACPNCYKIFKTYGTEFAVKTVYEVLAENSVSEVSHFSHTVTVHDPCAVRFDGAVQKAVRDLARKSGLTVEEMPHHGRKTLCCGEGGSVGFLSPELAGRWSSVRIEEAAGRGVVAYCAGCAGHLGKVVPVHHVLDLFFEPEATLAGKARISTAPVTYWNRIRLKKWFKQGLEVRATRERTFRCEGQTGPKRLISRLTALAAVCSLPVPFRSRRR
ncbi:MAG: (Fe-S)-binding protein [Syntrophobacteraceae bacterium]|nr:(Fe-S)-binding protein [Desulfobacteraceae bacterium]